MKCHLMLAAHLAMCAYIVWSVFVRAKWLDDRARPSIRLVFCILGGAALLGLVWPLARQWSPDTWSLAILAAICLVQRTTADRWREGVPDHFLCPCRPCESETPEKGHGEGSVT